MKFVRRSSAASSLSSRALVDKALDHVCRFGAAGAAIGIDRTVL